MFAELVDGRGIAPVANAAIPARLSSLVFCGNNGDQLVVAVFLKVGHFRWTVWGQKIVFL